MDARQYAVLPDPFPMWRRGVLHGARIAYETWGTLNAARDNALLLFTGLSPPAHAASSAHDPSPGWWEGMVQIVACEPAGAALLSGKSWAPHKIQGWTPDFVPAVLDREVPHRIVAVTDAEAVESTRNLAGKEGLFCGISSGATFAAALKVAAEAPEGAVLLAMLPDTGERYLSTVLFEGIAEGGDPEP